jgi:hypothetical protein
MAYALIPSPYAVVHIGRPIDTGDVDPDTGNPQLVPQPPVVRMVQSITQFGRRGSSREVIAAEYLERTETELHMSVADPTIYQPMDQIIVNPTLDCDGNWVTGSGFAYWIDGAPADSRKGPWPAYLKQFGGVVKLRRVT